jgi:branched-chain amino acid aminotransferase
MDEQVFLNGRIVPAAEASVSVFDAGFTHAAGLFETLRAYNGRVMRLHEHVRRLADSAATLELRIDVDEAAIEDGIDRLLKANGLTEARIRWVMTPGDVPRPGQTLAGPIPQTTLITAIPVQGYPPDLYEHGVRVCICPYKQNRLDPLAGHKTLSYLPRLLANNDAAQRGCNEALWFTTDNMLAEGSMSNVFIVNGETLLTPPLKTPVLPGVVRGVVLELAETEGIALEQRPIDIDALLDADEVFLTGSMREIMPVTAIEKHVVGEGTPGGMAKRLARLYKAQVNKECGIER